MTTLEMKKQIRKLKKDNSSMMIICTIATAIFTACLMHLCATYVTGVSVTIYANILIMAMTLGLSSGIIVNLIVVQPKIMANKKTIKSYISAIKQEEEIYSVRSEVEMIALKSKINRL